MKIRYITQFSIVMLAFFATQCAVKKDNTKKKGSSIQDQKTVVDHFKDDEYDTPLEKKWVDSIYNQMTFNEKLGQLFIVIAYSNKDTVHTNSVEKLITENKIGGVMFLQGGAGRQAKLTNKFQSKSKLPLFVAIDAEWGLSMRLDSTYRYPFNMTLGAIQDKNLIQKLGNQMGKQANRMGIQFVFSPVLDINTNPKNPIIGFRSFGEDKEIVTQSAISLMKGLQEQNVFSTAKHFPGHGDTSVDSHSALPTITFSKNRLEEVELYPYKKIIKEGLSSVMVAHLNVPSLEERPNYPSSVSYNIVTNILKNDLKFKGLIFTDGLNMKAASGFRKPGEIDLEAFLAGNDVLLCSENVPLAVENITNAYKSGLITEERITHSVKKILKYKYKAGLNNYKPIDYNNIVSDLNTTTNNALQYQLYENAITVLKNKNEILPIKSLENNKIAYLKLGDDTNDSFISTLKKYTEVTEIFDKNIDSLNVKLQKFNLVIIGYHKSDKPWAWKKHDFSASELLLIEEIAKKNNVILDVFATPYTLLQFQNFDNIKGLIMSYQNADIAQEVSAEIIFGAVDAKGKLPVSIGSNFNINDGITTKKLNRLGFTAPENVGMNPEILNKIETIANKAIDGKMTPGMQILVARKGKVIYQKSFGNKTYTENDKIQNSNLYDVASITKIVSTLPNIIKQYDEGKLTLDTRIGEMLPQTIGTNKDTIKIKTLLSHYARLQAWVPFYKTTLDSLKIPLKKYYSQNYTPDFSKKVSENLYIRNDYQDTIMKYIYDSKLTDKLEYKYSDFTFILLKEYLEQNTGKTLDVLSQENFYNSMGMNNTMYNPLQRVEITNVVPTEIDTYFRNSLLQGYVHDMAAAMQGGVAGHAGIFSNSIDLAKMMQMYLQKGKYGGVQYFSEQSFDDFNTCYFCSQNNRRGLGFDKPQLQKEGPTCGCVSMKSFGHTGFTGNIVWTDPETEIIYIFLSNRTYPDSNVPNKLSKENIREDIQKIIQEAIIEK